ncbi:hypothetical protein HPC38_06805 [Pasteurellaceae bacterium HPA106]|uniref:hypothetical protein n=1 Tax=Spirabiliibacterium pneumoniae TaxID=221400 RepID=UPI001AACC6B2|nr:hypothetical protein [Spirabiliibacterium pneumoniae]MBE2896583.1 hypothetical protein [Spirabiliibacterium pneumoniae]
MKTALFEIFRTGKHNGGGKWARKVWTESELKRIANLYNTEIKPAPLVIGHPENNLPEYGKVNRVIYCNNALFAEAEINNDLIGKIKSNQINGISSSFIPIENEKNPTKGISFYLNHVGFLEKDQKPAVKNMLPPEISLEYLYFNDKEDFIFYCENEDISFADDLNNKAIYLSQALDVDYKTALNLIIK